MVNFPSGLRAAFSVIFTLLLSTISRADLPSPTTQQRIDDMLSGQGAFVENKGQLQGYYGWNGLSDSVAFYLRNKGNAALFCSTGIDYGLQAPEGQSDLHLQLRFYNPSKNVQLESSQQRQGIYNYYTSDDQGLVAYEGIRSFDQVRYKGLYPGVDAVYYMNQGKLKYDFEVCAGTDMSQIQMTYAGIDQMLFEENGDLVLQTALGTIRDLKPYTYQVVNGQEVEIESRYVLKGYNRFGFEIGELADPEAKVIIDPYTIEWGTFVGVMGADAGGYPYEMKFGWDGSVFGSGRHHPNWPTFNAFDNVIFAGEGVVFRINADATAFIYASFVGGGGNDYMENVMGCQPNEAGELFITGLTEDATGFPLTNPNLGTVVTGAADAFVGKIAPDGTLDYMTLFGGAGDDRGFGVHPDAAGNIVFCGWTSSAGLGTAGADQPNYQGNLDGYVASINPNTNTLNYFSYVGGANDDACRKLDIDDAGDVYVVGGTNSATGIAGPTSFQNASNGTVDGFVIKYDGNLGGKIYGSYIGGTGLDDAEGIQVKCNGQAVIGGYTESADLPVVNAFQNTYGGVRDAMMVRVSASGASTLNTTYFGSTAQEGIKKNSPFDAINQQKNNDIAVNRRGEIALCVTTASAGLPVPDAFQAAPGGGNAGLADGYLHIFDSTGTQSVYGTYIGADGNDYATAGTAFDPVNDNRVLVGGASHSTLGAMYGTPGTIGPAAETLNDEYYCWVFAQCTLEVELAALPLSVCEGEDITFTGDTVCDATIPDSIIWTVNGAIVEGSSTSEWTTNELADGDEVCLIHLWLSECQEILQGDTACVTISIDQAPDFDITDTAACAPASIDLDPVEVYDSYLWSVGAVQQVLTVTASGTYHVTATTASGCSQRDTVEVTIEDQVVADIDDQTICNSGSIQVTPGVFTTYLWNDGDGTDNKVITASGQYHVTVTDASGCVGRDTFNVDLFDAPVLSNIVETCAGDNLTYTVSFDISGGDPGSYTVNGNAIAGTTFTSGPINSGDSYQFILSDINDCAPDTATGARLCNCTTSAGTMDQTTIEACPGDNVTFTHNGDHVMDANDTIMFIVHDQQGPSIGNVFHAEKGNINNTISTFGWGPGTYYVSTLAGDALLGDSVDLADLCLDVNLGQPIVIRDVPQATIDGLDSVCSGGQVPFDVSFDGTANYSYDILLDGALWGTFTSTMDTAFSTADSGQYTLSNFSNDHCPGLTSGTADAIIAPLPDSTLSVSDPAVCIGAFANINIENTQNGKTYQFFDITDMSAVGNSIDGNGGTIALNLAPTTDLTYVIEVTDTTFGCTTWLLDTAYVTVNPPVEGTVPELVGLCDPVATTPLILSNTVAGVDYTLRRTADNSIVDGPYNGTGGDLTFTVSGLVDDTFNVLATDNLGCDFELPDLGQVVIAPDIVLDTAHTDATCFSLCNGSAEFSYTGGIGDVSASYTFNGSTTDFTTDTSLTGLCGGTLTIDLTDSLNCAVQQSMEIIEPALLSVSLDQISPITCANAADGAITVATTGGTGAITYAWNSGQTTASIDGLEPETYIVEVTDENNCSASIGYTMSQPLPIDILTALTQDTVCRNEVVSITVVTSGGNDGHVITPFVNTQNVFTGIVSTDTTFTFTVVDDNGCTAVDSVQLFVPTYPILTQGDSDVVCTGIERRMTALTTGGMSPYTYNWDNGAGSASTYNITPTALGFVSTTLEVTDACGESDNTTYITAILDQPVTGFDWSVEQQCEDGILRLVNTSTAVNPTCNWQIFSGANAILESSTCDDFDVTLPPGTYDVQLDIDGAGCEDQDKETIEISIPPLVSADFTFDPSNPVPYDQTEISFTNLSENATQAYWTFDGLGNATDWEPTFEFPYEEPDTFVVSLEATNDIGCTDSVAKRVIIGGNIVMYIPNAFSPGGDGRNEAWGPHILGEVEFYELVVFNRWGDLIWASDQVGQWWDGMVFDTNVMAKQDVYTWKLTIRGTDESEDTEYMGKVTVIR